MSQSQNAQKRTYDDITFQKRRKLIRLIQKQRWTIKAAARQMGIKLCTAKHILYLYRREGKIYRKKGQIPAPPSEEEPESEVSNNNVVYVPLPYYIFCFYSPDTVPINFEHYQQV